MPSGFPRRTGHGHGSARRTRDRRPAPVTRAAAATVLALSALLLTAGPSLALEASPDVSADVKTKYEKAANEVLCYCGCARQTIKECSCSVAFDLRADWERRIAAGETPERIVAEYIDEHGEQSRSAPPRRGFNLLAWFGPGIAILVAMASTFIVISVWAARGRRAKAAADGAAPTGPDLDASVRERLERELREFDR